MKRTPLRPGKPLERRSPLPSGSGRPTLKRSTPIKAKGGSRFPKQRQPAYTRWIKTLGCLIDRDCFGPIDPAHVNKTRAQGAPDMGEVVPLCRRHHDEQEGHAASFGAKHGMNLPLIAKAFAEVWVRDHPEESV